MKREILRRGSLDSTQNEARRIDQADRAAGRSPRSYVVLAESQTAGRGRLGRPWASPPGGLYATLAQDVDEAVFDLPTLRAGLALAESLAHFGVETKIKWPNDLLFEGQKIAGILAEASAGRLYLGVGVNLAASPDVAGAGGIEAQTGRRIDREELFARFLSRLDLPRGRDAIASGVEARLHDGEIETLLSQG